MNASDAVKLCRYVKAACPQQAMDEYTPQAWADLLADVPFADGHTAARTLAKRQPFVAPSEIIAEVKKIRAQRVKDGDHKLIPPPFTTVGDYREWLKDVRGRLADGESVESINAGCTRGELVERPEIRLALAVGPVKRDVQPPARHEITQDEINRGRAALEEAMAAAAKTAWDRRKEQQ